MRIRRRHIVSVFELLTLLVTATSTADDDIIVNNNPDTSSPPQDTLIISLFAVVCAIFVSFLAVLLAFFTFMEDGLLRRYQREGTLLRAKVDSESVLFLRHVAATSQNNNQCCCWNDNNTKSRHEHEQQADQECSAMIEYRSVDPDPQTFTKRVRKQVRIYTSDLLLPEIWRPTADGASTANPVVDLMPEERVVIFEGPVPSHDRHDAAVLELEILQIPQFKTSALPYQQVQRACSWKYRLPTVFMVTVLVLLAAGCIGLAVQTSASAQTDVGLATTALMSILLTLEILLVHSCGGEYYMSQALREEYLEGGELLLGYGDSGSLSSGDDMYLMM
jgi:hypothetical protein